MTTPPCAVVPSRDRILPSRERILPSRDRKGAVAALLLATAAVAHAQTGDVKRGERLFTQHCAVPYCHGPGGTAGRAPALQGHSHNTNSMFKVITWGIAGTGMPEFTTRLTTREIADLVAYAMTLRGDGRAAASPPPPPRTLTDDEKQGRALFFDSGRTGACGACHQLDGWGVPVGPDLAAAPKPAAPRVRTARPAGGEAPFPALLVEHTESTLRVYDLTGPLPVLRTFPAGQVALEPGSPWRHRQATRLYTGAELRTLERYLRRRLP